MNAKRGDIPTKYFYSPIHNLVFGGVKVYDYRTPWINWAHTLYSILLMAIFCYGYIVTEILYIIKFYNDLEQVTLTLCYLSAHINALSKIMVILIKRKEIGDVLISLESSVFLPNVNRGGSKEISIMKEAVKQVKRQPIVFLVVVCSMLCNRIIPCAINRVMALRTQNGTQIMESPLPYPSTLPFHVEEQKFPNYEIISLYQIVSIALFGWYLGNCDTIITGIMIHLTAQFRIVNNAILTAVERAERTTYGNRDETRYINGLINAKTKTFSNKISVENVPKYKSKFAKAIQKSYNQCVQHHIAILNLMENLENTFTLIILLQFMVTLAATCVGLYQCSLVEITSPSFISMFSFTIAILFQLLIYCWNGNEVTLESVKVARAAYDSRWFGADEDSKKSLILIMIRAQRPCVLTAAKFTNVSLEAFTNIVKTAFSFFMVLRQMNEEAAN